MNCRTWCAYLIVMHHRWGVEVERDLSGGYAEVRLIGKRGTRLLTTRRCHRDYDREDRMLSS